MERLDNAQHIVFSTAARGSPCIWTGEVVSEEMLSIIISDPVEPENRVTLSLGGLSELTVSYGREAPKPSDEITQLSPSGHVKLHPTDDAVRTCVECSDRIASSSPVVILRQHTASGHPTSSMVHTHRSCLTDLTTTLSEVWNHTDSVIGDLL